MTIYDDAQAVASEVLAEFKQGVIQYIRVTPGNGPVDNPGPATETPFTLDAVARGVKFKYIQNGLAVASDMQLTMAVRQDVTPEMKGFVTLDGTRYKMVAVMPIPPAGTPVAYRLIFRK